MSANMETATSTWWRWPLLPFGAFVGAFAASIAAAIFFWLSAKIVGFGENGWYFRYIVPVIVAALFGHVFVLISCRIAPKGKVIAGTVMVTILGILSVVGVAYGWHTASDSVGEQVQATVGAITTMIAAVYSLVGEAASTRKASSYAT